MQSSHFCWFFAAEGMRSPFDAQQHTRMHPISPLLFLSNMRIFRLNSNVLFFGLYLFNYLEALKIVWLNELVSCWVCQLALSYSCGCIPARRKRQITHTLADSLCWLWWWDWLVRGKKKPLCNQLQVVCVFWFFIDLFDSFGGFCCSTFLDHSFLLKERNC